MPEDETSRPDFVRLSDLLRAGDNAARRGPDAWPAPVAEPAVDAGAGEAKASTGPAVAFVECAEAVGAIRAARLFRAAVADAFDTLAAQLARELALEVLMRELQLSPADVTALAHRLVNDRFAQGPLRLRVAPADAHVVCDLPVATDSRLEPGDAVLECRNGEIDARMAVRLAAVLARLTP